jgi:ubiquinone/menaquinone biosynthesis C-methylase UbiE
LSNYYDGIAPLYDVSRPLPSLISEQVTDCILELVKATPETKFLEPGIGTGRTALPIIKRGYSYTGVDISKEMMDELKRKLHEVPDNLTLIQADASSLMFEDDGFDVVLTTHVLHLLPNLFQGLSEIRRVLKPSGYYLACENLQTQHQKDFEGQLRAMLAPYQEKSLQTTQVISYPSPYGEELAQVLIQQGATVERVTAARWQVEQTVGELLDAYELRPYGVCWLVPENIFFQVMREFRKWCLERYGSEDVVLASEATFEITVVSNWA